MFGSPARFGAAHVPTAGAEPEGAGVDGVDEDPLVDPLDELLDEPVDEGAVGSRTLLLFWNWHPDTSSDATNPTMRVQEFLFMDRLQFCIRAHTSDAPSG